MSDNTLKNALIVLVLLLLLVFVWQPLSRLFNAAPITNDFVLDTANGVLDSRNLRGNVLAISFAYAHCEDECSDRLARLAAGLRLLSTRDRSLVRVIVVSVDPDRDTPASSRPASCSLRGGSGSFSAASSRPTSRSSPAPLPEVRERSQLLRPLTAAPSLSRWPRDWRRMARPQSAAI